MSDVERRILVVSKLHYQHPKGGAVVASLSDPPAFIIYIFFKTILHKLLILLLSIVFMYLSTSLIELYVIYLLGLMPPVAMLATYDQLQLLA